MDEYRWNYHVPAFGGWDYEEDDLPYTQCFESARQAGFARFAAAYSDSADVEDRDLYVAGDLYQNDILTPAVIVVPRRRQRKGGYSNNKNVKGVKKQEKEEYNWGGYSSYDIKEPPSPIISPPKPTKKSKAVDEDLYKIPPEFLHVKPRKKKGFGLFSSCLQPACT
ncbi:uncharacterized protein LOC110727560 isoform X1 [Chenopodium quinoa]|uniref:uncharacterized protein LOC110727560 isoform X1 n=1 Tax=Chenopodium quinoa TaxID=63459 RepID=UPI000B77918D|nr:uncharacterized protein LOC110727560 isoform X1 [Chenopodium quinoa]